MLFGVRFVFGEGLQGTLDKRATHRDHRRISDVNKTPQVSVSMRPFYRADALDIKKKSGAKVMKFKLWRHFGGVASAGIVPLTMVSLRAAFLFQETKQQQHTSNTTKINRNSHSAETCQARAHITGHIGHHTLSDHDRRQRFPQ